MKERTRLHQRVGDLVVDLFGGGGDAVDAVQGEVLGRCRAVAGIHQGTDAALRVHKNNILQTNIQ